MRRGAGNPPNRGRVRFSSSFSPAARLRPTPTLRDACVSAAPSLLHPAQGGRRHRGTHVFQQLLLPDEVVTAVTMITGACVSRSSFSPAARLRPTSTPRSTPRGACVSRDSFSPCCRCRSGRGSRDACVFKQLLLGAGRAARRRAIAGRSSSFSFGAADRTVTRSRDACVSAAPSPGRGGDRGHDDHGRVRFAQLLLLWPATGRHHRIAGRSNSFS